ncbi:MAG TPA: NeuD/PglB/VioB family sugar acetyltransferase [Cyclobacteriaceae bacterium]
MVVIGAGGHAKEIAGIFAELDQDDNLIFYDDITPDLPLLLFDRFQIVRHPDDLKKVFKHDPRFVIGVGNPAIRKILAEKFITLGGKLTSIISPFANIGKFNVTLGEGLNIMTGAVITQDVIIGQGSLLHVHTSVHHDCRIGEYCELQPGSHILGHVKMGNHCVVGSGATILPRIVLGNNVVVGAGAVVTKNLADGVKVKGVPARS